jgi:hypothetical protein
MRPCIGRGRGSGRHDSGDLSLQNHRVSEHALHHGVEDLPIIARELGGVEVDDPD